MERVVHPANIAAAIKRSQRARSKLRARRRRTAAIAAALAVATAVPLSLTFADIGADDVAHAAVAKAQSLVDLLDNRSPGARTEAQLTKTKRHQAALAKMRPAPRRQAAAPPTHTLANILIPPPAEKPVELAAAPLLVAPAPSLETLVSPGGVGGFSPGGGGTGGSPGGGGAVVPHETPNTSGPETKIPLVEAAVPEPATWAMMLLGFGLIGWRVRRSPRATPQIA